MICGADCSDGPALHPEIGVYCVRCAIIGHQDNEVYNWVKASKSDNVMRPQDRNLILAMKINITHLCITYFIRVLIHFFRHFFTVSSNE